MLGAFDMLVAAMLLVPLLLVAVRVARRPAPTLVLQKFAVYQKPQSFGLPVVEIMGRSQGLIAFLLTTMGFSANTKLTVTNSEVQCETASLFGQRFQFILLSRVATIGAGLHKPVGYLVASVLLLFAGGLCLLAGLSTAPAVGVLVFVVGFVTAAILVVLYFFTKKFFIEVYPNGGPRIALLFKPSAIEGVSVDVEQALACIATIRDVVTGAGRTSSAAQQSSSPPALNSPGVAVPRERAQPIPSGLAVAAPAVDSEAQAKAASAHAIQVFNAGQKAQGIELLQKVVRDFPASTAARQAENNLQRLAAHEH